MQPAELALPSFPSETANFTVAFYVYVQSMAVPAFFLSCNSFTSGSVDCAELYTIPAYGLLVTRLNQNGQGQGANAPIPTGTWTHLAVTYEETAVSPTTQLSSGLFTTYINGVIKQQYPQTHTVTQYGAPVIAGDGDSGNPVQGSFINLRMYTRALTAVQVAQIRASDYPQAPAVSSSSGSITPQASAATPTVYPANTYSVVFVIQVANPPPANSTLNQSDPLVVSLTHDIAAAIAAAQGVDVNAILPYVIITAIGSSQVNATYSLRRLLALTTNTSVAFVLEQPSSISSFNVSKAASAFASQASLGNVSLPLSGAVVPPQVVAAPQYVGAVPPSSAAPLAPLTYVFMLAGQSNMVGFNTDSSPANTHTVYDLPQITQLGRYTSGGYSADGNDDMKIVQGMDPLEFDNSAYYNGPEGSIYDESGVGPGMSFAYSFVQGTGYNVTLIPCAVGSSGFPAWSPGQQNYGDCLTRTSYALSLNNTVFGGILWLQGEANSDPLHTVYSQSAYITAVQEMVAGFRSALRGGDNSSFLLATMRPEWVDSGGFPAAVGVQAAIKAMPFNIPRSSVIYGYDQTGVTSLPYGNGLIHYSASAQRYLGTAYFNAYRASLYNTNDSVIPGPIVQLFAGAYDNRQSMRFYWPPDPVAVRYTLTVYNDATGALVQNVSTSNSSYLFPITTFSPNTTYHALVSGVGPTGVTGFPSPTNVFVGVHPFSYYTAGYPAWVEKPSMWLIGDTVMTAVSNGAGVAYWEDVSGHGNGMVQTNTAVQPTLQTNFKGNHSTVVFDSDHMSTGLDYIPTNMTFVFVLSVLYVSGYTGYHNAFLGTNLFLLWVNDPDAVPDWAQVPGGFLPGATVPINATLTPTIVSLEWYHLDEQTAEVQYYVNGKAVGSAYGNAFNASTSAIVLGAESDGNPFYQFHGDISEVIMIDAAVSDSDRYAVEKYLSVKYSIPIEQPPPVISSSSAAALPVSSSSSSSSPWSSLVSAVSSSVSLTG